MRMSWRIWTIMASIHIAKICIRAWRYVMLFDRNECNDNIESPFVHIWSEYANGFSEFLRKKPSAICISLWFEFRIKNSDGTNVWSHCKIRYSLTIKIDSLDYIYDAILTLSFTWRKKITSIYQNIFLLQLKIQVVIFSIYARNGT